MKYYNFFGAKIAKLTFFQFLNYKSLLFCFKSEWQFSCGFFWPRSLPIPPEAKLWASATSMRSQILAKDASFHMKQCLFDQHQNWSVQRPRSLSGSVDQMLSISALVVGQLYSTVDQVISWSDAVYQCLGSKSVIFNSKSGHQLISICLSLAY